MPLPQIGEVHDGYRYAGGDPNQKASWKYVGASSGVAQAAPGAPGAAYMAPGAAPKLVAQDYKDLAGMRSAAQTALSARSDATRFQSLNKRESTGGLGGLPVVRDVRAMFDPGLAEMKAIGEKLTPAQREAGSGAMSDRDVEMYRAATLGLDKPQQANDAMAKVIRAGALRQADQSAFYEEFARRNGALLGASEAWSAYANANPLFEEGENGNTSVRGWTPWRKWFGIEQQAESALQGTQGQAAAPQGDVASAAPKRIRYDAQGRVVQ